MYKLCFIFNLPILHALHKKHLTNDLSDATQRAKFARKVHKPPLGANVINFELNGFNVFLWVP